MIEGKRILITGGAGSIGSELARQLAPKNKLFILDNNETSTFLLREDLKQKGFWCHSRTGDVRNRDTVYDVFSDFKPQIVIHAAAVKHVTPNNEYPEEAFTTNIDGTVNVVREAKNYECLEKFVFVSTDKVVNAHCIMGITKLCAENYVRLQGDKFISVRFGNVMSSRGSVFDIWQKQFDAKEPLTITDLTMERYMMSIPEACSLIIQAASRDHGGLMILDMGERHTLAELLVKFLNSNKAALDYPQNVIGVRAGETQIERLMTSDEELKAVKEDKFYVIR